MTAGFAGLTVLRQGQEPARVETSVPRWLDAKHDGPATRSGVTREARRHQPASSPGVESDESAHQAPTRSMR